MANPAAKAAGLYEKFKRKAFTICSFADQNDRSASGHEMHRVLGAFDLLMLGIGCIIGAGIMVLTGVAAREYAGPGVVLSYTFGGFAAMISALCYAEYAAAFPLAGGAFNYVSLTFGEFTAWVVACDLILEYTLSAAAVAKGFTAYFASLINVNLDKLSLHAGIFTFDIPALLAVIVLSLVLMRSTAESSMLNIVVVVIHLLLIAFVICAGLPFAEEENFHPFLPFGMRGVFAGTAVVFFSFIGFDTVATAAEEVKNPPRDLPIGIIGSLTITTILYIMMCVTITGMQPYYDIDLNAPFSAAFESVGLSWARTIVAAGALAGIMTSLLGALLGQARIYVTLGRQHLLTPWIARVNERTRTPINATIVTMCTAGLLALFLEIQLLAELVSIGTLVVFCVVDAGVLFRRYHVTGSGESMKPILVRLLLIVLFSIAFSISYNEYVPWPVPVVFIILWFLTALSFILLPVKQVPELFTCPGSPIVPAFGMFVCMHLIGSLGWPAYVRWVVWFVLGTVVYLSYGIHHTQGESNQTSLLEQGASSSAPVTSDSTDHPPPPTPPGGDVQLVSKDSSTAAGEGAQAAPAGLVGPRDDLYTCSEEPLAPDTKLVANPAAPDPESWSSSSPTREPARSYSEEVGYEGLRRQSAEAKRALLESMDRSDEGKEYIKECGDEVKSRGQEGSARGQGR